MKKEERTKLLDTLIEGQLGKLKKAEYCKACSDAVDCIIDLVNKVNQAQRSADATSQEALRSMMREG